MNDLAPLIAAGCGFATICAGLLVLGGFLMMRMTRNSFLVPLVNSFTGRSELQDDEDREPPVAPQRASSAADLRAKAQSLDFDAAVQKYQQPGAQSAPPTSLPPSGLTTGTTPINPSGLDEIDRSRYSLRNRRDNTGSAALRNDRRRADEGEDMLGGLLSGEEDLPL